MAASSSLCPKTLHIYMTTYSIPKIFSPLHLPINSFNPSKYVTRKDDSAQVFFQIKMHYYIQNG